MNRFTTPLITIYQSDRYIIELLGGTSLFIWDNKFKNEQRVELDDMYPKDWSVFRMENGVSRLETRRFLRLKTFKEYVEFFKIPSLVDHIIVFYEFVYEDSLESGHMEVAS